MALPGVDNNLQYRRQLKKKNCAEEDKQLQAKEVTMWENILTINCFSIHSFFFGRGGYYFFVLCLPSGLPLEHN